jgi:cell division protein FtsL
MVSRIPSKQRNALVARERDAGAMMRLALLLLCGLVLASGFVYAGGRHFAALRLGYQTEELRKVREQLAEEQRRFLLARESAASPARLERAARELGMQTMQVAQIDPLRRFTSSSTGKTLPERNQPTVASRTAAVPARSAQAKPIRKPTTGRTEPLESQSDSARTR